MAVTETLPKSYCSFTTAPVSLLVLVLPGPLPLATGREKGADK
jgi:hypothetical protein